MKIPYHIHSINDLPVGVGPEKIPTSDMLSAITLTRTDTVIRSPRIAGQQSYMLPFYYNPVTGARSALSTSSMRWQSIHGDVIRGILIHPAGSVWVSRG